MVLRKLQYMHSQQFALCKGRDGILYGTLNKATGRAKKARPYSIRKKGEKKVSYYYETENQSIITEEDIRSIFEDEKSSEIRSTYEEDFRFCDYIEHCMHYNNGTLYTIHERYDDVRNELNRKIKLAEKYGYDEYSDELADLLAEMHTLSKLM